MIQNSHTTIFHIRETPKFFFHFSIYKKVNFFEGPMNFAMMKGNLEILKFLNKSINSPNDYQKLPRVRDPRCHFKVVGTGHYNYRSLGIKKIRRLNMSRGNRWFHEKKIFLKILFLQCFDFTNLQGRQQCSDWRCHQKICLPRRCEFYRDQTCNF